MNYKLAYVFMLILFCIKSFSQNPTDSIKVKKMNEVIITSKKASKKVDFIPTQIENITKKDIEFQNFQNTADLLANSGNLHVQKSQQGGGSPVIRGFESSRVLLMVDDVRMNNLIFRAGHLQNVITIDENTLANVSIFFGPTSSLFGSDALGGTINMKTKSAEFLKGAKKTFSGNINKRYSSANNEKSLYFDLNYALENFASLTAISINDFDDLRMGKKRNHNEAFFGERNYFVATIDGVDILNTNQNKFIQKFSGYTQYNLLQKLAYKTTSNFTHGLNIQYSTTSNIPRYDRLTDASNSTTLRNAEWFYGPQSRLLAVYSIEKEKAFLGSDLSVNFGYQDVRESRNNRKFGNLELQKRDEKINVHSVTLDLNKNYTKGELFYGFESYFETLKSEAEATNILTNISRPIDSRYPNGKNNMFRNDLFISYNHKSNEKFGWNTGGRIGYTTLKSTISDNSFFSLPFKEINQGNLTYSTTFGLLYKPSKNAILKTNISTGFRVPNIDDLGKIFESGNGTVIVPNSELKPEKSITGDLGFELLSDSKKTSFETIYYYTKIIDAIITDVFSFNNQGTINYNGVNSVVLANQNKQEAFITGFSTRFKTEIVRNLLFSANFNYTLGRIVKDNDTRFPLDHIPPYYGKIGFLYSKNIATVEAYLLYNGKKDIKDYFLNGEDNEQYAPKDGMPAWETYNIKASFTILKNGTLFAGVENILDTQYRTFASGINAPGRNIYGGFKYTY